ncbi:MAG: DUF3078 domain-containing protein [Nitritalea sp.]
MMKRFLWFALAGLLFSFFSISLGAYAQSEEDRLMLADTLLIAGDTIIMLGDSVIIKTAEKPQYWKKRGNFSLSLQQVTLNNWAAGGASNFALNSSLLLGAEYAKDKKVWDTNLTVNIGFNRQADRRFPTRKTNDNFLFISKYGRELSSRWLLSTQLDTRTQLLPGYRFFRPAGAELDARDRISDLFSPAFIQSSTGLNYRRQFDNGSRISIIGSPFTGRFTVVLDDSLSRAGAFGVTPGERVNPEAGVSISSTTDIIIMENVRWRADLNLFSNFERLGNTVVNLNSVITLRVNKYITTRIETVLIYDEAVRIPQDAGPPIQAVQLQNLINFGIGIDF